MNIPITGAGNPANAPTRAIPKILDAVVSQHSDRRIKFGTDENSIWFALSALQMDERTVFARLANAGFTYLTPKKKAAFREKIEDHEDYRPGLVASTPGPIGEHFVFGDGTVESKPGSAEVIVAFDGEEKFCPVGTLAAWQEEVGSVVKGQPLLLFILCLAFLPAILRFIPGMNPLFELIGEPESGKTTAGLLAASVWVGNSFSEVGGGLTWDLTVNAFDVVKVQHAGALLFLDEGNLAGSNERDRKDVIRKVIFKASSKGGRKRLTEKVAPPNVDFALLSTSNQPLRNVIHAKAAELDAMRTRMVTVVIGQNLGVLTHTPDGFDTTEEAVDHLRNAVKINHGVAARAFIQRLVKADPKMLQAKIDREMARFARKLPSFDGDGNARTRRMFSSLYAAGVLARRWRVLPAEWGDFAPALLAVWQAIDKPVRTVGKVSAVKRFNAYFERFESSMIPTEQMDGPLSPAIFEEVAGVIARSERRTEIVISTVRFKKSFPDHVSVMKELRAQGAAKTEHGKLSIKTPRPICASGRAYVITLPVTNAKT
ncbi:DUF927 domain-containing protein [Mesorhizobium sp. M0030]|uniref:DUF927 domain-containing protein n=1 Tax=Mesorhizobium sp. M0030 TaxID=2956851 RepID=UPI003335EC48